MSELDPRKYTVGWISALPLESVAARAFLDEEYGVPENVSPQDNNSYILGRIGSHRVVIAVLPDGEYGLSSAAVVAEAMRHSFPNVRIGLMVGIGGGVPSAKHDIRLGDVVVSSRNTGSGHGGVFQYDFGKAIQNQGFQETGSLNQPPMVLRTAVSTLKGTYEMRGHQLEDDVNEALKKIKRRKNYTRPAPGSDRLFKSSAVHPREAAGGCELCGMTNLVIRDKRDEEDDDPAIHYGLIASGNQLMKDALVRDKMAAEKDVLCFEMEAAGLMNHFPCLVIRGICDYSDSHKNKEWQGFAAMMAAAYAKDLLRQIPASRIEAEKPISEAIGVLETKIEETKKVVDSIAQADSVDRIKAWLLPPDPSTNANRARKIRHSGSGKWLLEDSTFQEWESGSRRHLWLRGLVGCGKTVLTVTILDHLEARYPHQCLSFFFDFSETKKQTVDGMVRSLAIQLYQHGRSGGAALLNKMCAELEQKEPETKSLWEVCCKMLGCQERTFIMLDALDESTTRTELLTWLREAINSPELSHVQFLMTARPEPGFLDNLPSWIGESNSLNLDGKVDSDIQWYVLAKLAEDPRFLKKKIPEYLIKLIHERVGLGAGGMFRWAACQLDLIADCNSPLEIEETLRTLPNDLNETYHRIIQRIPDRRWPYSMRLLQWIVYARTPLLLEEAIEVLATNIDNPPERSFTTKARVFDETAVLNYCPGLLSVVHKDGWIRRGVWGKPPMRELHLAHFSVREFLVRQENFDVVTSNAAIAKTCLRYIGNLELSIEDSLEDSLEDSIADGIVGSIVDGIMDSIEDRNADSIESIFRDFPLARCAATSWTSYAVIAESADHLFKEIINFLSHDSSFKTWVLLTEEGRHPTRFSPKHESKLWYCFSHNLIRVARYLIENGADVNGIGGRYGHTCLQIVLSQEDEEVMQLLLDHGADINTRSLAHYPTLTQAALWHSQRKVEMLLATGSVDLEIRDYGFGRTALAWAVTRGRNSIVRLLIDAGSDLNARDTKRGQTPLSLSVSTFDPENIVDLEDTEEVVSTLLQAAGVDVNSKDNDGRTALIYAAMNKVTTVAKILLETGAADMNLKDNLGRSALHWACLGRENEALVRLLLETGVVDVDSRDNEGMTPLMLAAKMRHEEFVVLLLDVGDADFALKDKFGRTAEDLGDFSVYLRIHDRAEERGG